jgi:hypothetical protein
MDEVLRFVQDDNFIQDDNLAVIVIASSWALVSMQFSAVLLLVLALDARSAC